MKIIQISWAKVPDLTTPFTSNICKGSSLYNFLLVVTGYLAFLYHCLFFLAFRGKSFEVIFCLIRCLYFLHFIRPRQLLYMPNADEIWIYFVISSLCYNFPSSCVSASANIFNNILFIHLTSLDLFILPVN